MGSSSPSVSVFLVARFAMSNGFGRDGTIVSGDSMGLVKFWDIKTSTQIKSIRAHEADVLCLAVGSVRLYPSSFVPPL